MAETEGLLVKLRSSGNRGFAAAKSLGEFEPILEVPRGTADAFGLASPDPAVWVRVDAGGDAWDRAHHMMARGFAADGNEVLAAEPDMAEQWPMWERETEAPCQRAGQSGKGGKAVGKPEGWHLRDEFSGLRSARGEVSAEDQAKVTVVHLDTGYDPQHVTCPRNIDAGRQRNFTREGKPDSAIDVTPTGGLLNSRGHGPGTIGILAGAEPAAPIGGYDDEIGGAPDVAVIPVRIANSVVRLSTGTVARGFGYAADCAADIVSMSMGGLASAAVADAVNLCYDKGIVMVTAAGNFVRKGRLSSPRSIVYPARMRRVLAATGVMADGNAYYGLAAGELQGCHGPDSKMDTALAGWTPNILWPELGCTDVIDHDGAGTSSSTAQVAAAAALWIANYRAKLAKYPEAWMKGEAVRQALMRSARKTTARLDKVEVREMLGAGALDARAALAAWPLAAGKLEKAPVASASWAWLRLLTGRGVGVAAAALAPRERMLELEILQIAGTEQVEPELRDIGSDPEAEDVSDKQRRRYLETVRDSGLASNSLRHAIDRALGVRTPSLRKVKT
ncbi:MAG: S8/S53 family peptidase, partial [Sphingomonadaceae bacterium]